MILSAKRLADKLRKDGIEISCVSEGDDVVDGEVGLTNGFHVQVGFFENYFGLRQEIPGKGFLVLEPRDRYQDLLNDIKTSVYRQQAKALISCINCNDTKICPWCDRGSVKGDGGGPCIECFDGTCPNCEA